MPIHQTMVMKPSPKPKLVGGACTGRADEVGVVPLRLTPWCTPAAADYDSGRKLVTRVGHIESAAIFQTC